MKIKYYSVFSAQSRNFMVVTLLLSYMQLTGAKGQSINEVSVSGVSSLVFQSISGDGNFAGGVADFPGGQKRVVRVAKNGAIISSQISNGYNINVTGMSQNGGRLVGFFQDVSSNLYRGFSWAPSSDGFGSLTILTPQSPSTFVGVEARGVSADGTVVACRLIGPTNTKAATYPGTTGRYRIFEETTTSDVDVEGISADGSLVLGSYQASSTSVSLPSIVDFGTVPTPGLFTVGNQRGEICCVSSDGTVLSGLRRFPGNSTVAMRWSIQNGSLVASELGFLESSSDSTVTAMSSDGRRIIGWSAGQFIWDLGKSIRSLRTALVNEFSIDMTSWPTLSGVGGMSSDGSQIVGTTSGRAYWIDLRRPLTATIEPAVKISYSTITGRSYQPQYSLDLSFWNNDGAPRQGTGMMEAFYSEKTEEKKFFRVQEITP